jgi:nucleotide-binding universal stress UspA family protein
MGTIVVGVDDSDGARAALGWALRQAAVTGDRVRVVHAYEINLAWIDDYNPDIPDWERRARAKAEATAAAVLDDVIGDRARDGVEVCAVEGSPARALAEAANDAVLVVVGSRGRGGFAGLLLGSVSHRVALHSPCPVVIVPLPHDEPRTGAEP